MSGEPQTLLDGLPFEASGPEWLAAQRTEAASALRERGLPNKKVEAFRFTPLRGVTDGAFRPAEGKVDAPEVVARHGDDGTYPVVIAGDGPILDSAGVSPDGVTVRSLATVLKEKPASLEGILGSVASREHFAGLNAAMFRDGLVIHVAPRARPTRPLELLYVPTDDDAVAYPRVLVVVGRGAEVTLVETFLPRGEGAPLTNAVTELIVEDDAKVEHVRSLVSPERVLSHVAVRQARDSRYAARSVAVGGSLSRTELTVTFTGPGAECDLDGVSHVAGTDVVDHHVLVRHAAEACTTHQTYRAIADEKGTYVFDGIVVAERGANRTEAHQESKNLLLSDDATVHTKPHLEIDTDDITASHGATVGALEEDQVFYLQSRGVGEVQARAILTFAFVAELLQKVSHEPLRERLMQAVRGRLPHGEMLEGFVP